MVEYVLNFVRGVEREDKNFDGDTALMLAVLYSDLKMVKWCWNPRITANILLIMWLLFFVFSFLQGETSRGARQSWFELQRRWRLHTIHGSLRERQNRNRRVFLVWSEMQCICEEPPRLNRYPSSIILWRSSSHQTSSRTHETNAEFKRHSREYMSAFCCHETQHDLLSIYS